MTWGLKDIGLATVYSYVIITILNYLFHMAFPSIPILRTGIAILLFFVGIIIASIFTISRDGQFGKDDISGFLTIVAVVIGLYFALRWALPELFSTYVPIKLQEVFSILG